MAQLTARRPENAEKSYAAASYLIQQPEGNILIDSPRFTPPLVKQLEAMGGVQHHDGPRLDNLY